MHKSLMRSFVAAAAAGAALVANAAPAAAEAPAPQASVVHTVLTGAQEAPGPGDPDGHGVFVGIAKGTTLCYVLTAIKIEPATAAHIHVAPVGEPGPIVVPLEEPTDGNSQACTTVEEETLNAILTDPGSYYVNVHNDEFPAGAIRGQLS